MKTDRTKTKTTAAKADSSAAIYNESDSTAQTIAAAISGHINLSSSGGACTK